MKKLILGTVIATAMMGYGKEAAPGTANAFVEINPYKTPIVTNAEEAVYAAMSPTGVKIEMPAETAELAQGKMRCYPKRMNVITNTVDELMDLDDGLVCTFISNYRTGEIYFGPEYRELIINPPEHAITIKPDGVMFNGSTNNILVTQIPAIIRTEQFLDTNIYVTIEYPQYTYKLITLDSISVADGVISISGANLDSIDNLTSNIKKLQYVVNSGSTTNNIEFTLANNVLTNATLAKSAEWTAGKKFTFLATTAKKAFTVKYETKTIDYQIPGLMSAKPIVIKDAEDAEEEVGFFGSIWKFFTDLF